MTRSRSARIVASMLGVAILGACSPTVTEFTVAEGEPGERLATVVSLRANATSIEDVSLSTAVAGSGSFGTGQLLAATGDTYSGQTEPRGPGDYEARVDVRYRRLFLPGLQTLTRTIPYSLVWPAATFGFEGGETGVDGWTFQGVFLENGNPVPCGPETLATLFSRSDAGWPGPIGSPEGFSNGSLRVLLAEGCFPSSTDSDEQWQFNLVSPDLTGRPEWQGIGGVSFRMISQVPVRAMATGVYDGAGGSVDYVSPMLPDESLDFENVSNTWTTVVRTDYLPEDRPLRRILIRVFGDQGWLAGSPAATLLLDVVQPLP